MKQNGTLKPTQFSAHVTFAMKATVSSSGDVSRCTHRQKAHLVLTSLWKTRYYSTKPQ